MSDNALVRRRILVVEDHRDSADTLHTLLVRDGHEVHTARNIAEAQRLCALHPFDVCLLDIHLPDGSGLDLARLLKARNKARLIAVTAGGFQKDADAIAAAGFDAYLLKPYKIAEMRAVLDGDRGRLAQ